MIEKTNEKEIAIKLRKEGKTYREILEVVHVAKSTLSLWLRSVGMAKRQRQRHTKARLRGSKKGGEARKKDRIERTLKIMEAAKSEIREISQRELFLIGIVLYWAEGSKEKPNRPGSSFQFINMDSLMIALFIRWLIDICKIPKDMIGFETYIHENHAFRIEEVREHWAKVTGFPIEYFTKIRYKKNLLSITKRKNTGDEYFGCLKIVVKKSSSLVRKVSGWVSGIMECIDK